MADPTPDAPVPQNSKSARRILASDGAGVAQAGWLAARASLGNALLAATGGIALMLVTRVVLSIPTPAELLGDRLTALIPLSLFSALLTFFGHDAKHYFFGGLLVAQGLATALLVAAYWGARAAMGVWRQARPGGKTAVSVDSGPSYVDVVALVVLYWLITALIVAPLIGAGFAGTGVSGGVLGLLESAAIPSLATALIFVGLASRQIETARSRPAEAGATEAAMSRRRMLRQVGFAVAILAGTAAVWEGITRLATTLGATKPALHLNDIPSQVPPPIPNYGTWQEVAGAVPEVTPTPAFYYVSKNLAGDPSVNINTWRLTVTGMVDRPQSLTYDQLRALAAQMRYQTLECISNDIGGNLMSNALWTGTSLADLLRGAGIQEGASEVIFRSADGYSDRLHLTQALDDRALIVYLINGSPLPGPHGYPARLLVPGLYGMKNGKWLTSLEVAGGNYQGYWEQRGWTPEARVKLMSRIDVPADGDFLPRKPMTIAGVAFSGDQGIGQVDVSTDGGSTWAPARLKRPLASLTWVLWEMPWSPGQGSHVLAVRAIDLAGRVQTPHEAPPLPDGASGYHAITVTGG